MEWALLGVVGVVTIVAAGVFSKKLGVAAPLILIVIGVCFSYLPGTPTELPPELVLAGLLPPILYAAAINVPVVDFRRNFNTISALSVVLVLVTAFGTGLILYMIFPDLSLAAGIAIGAVISPTDAVAATALGKRLGLPPRLVTILEGESLVNDATALVLLRSAVAAAAATVSFWGVLGDFVYAAALATLIGIVVGYLTVFVRSKLRDPKMDTVVSLAVPFIAFIPAESLRASGVLAVVVAGLYSGHNIAQRFSAQARISERLNWRTAQFVLENGVFLLMGLQISSLIGEVERKDLSAFAAIGLGLGMTVVIVVIRAAFVAPLLYLLRRREARVERQQNRFGEMLGRLRGMTNLSASLLRRKDRAEKIYQRRQADL